MKFYRFYDSRTTAGVQIYRQEFFLIKETPKGYWIDYYGEKKWVSNSARNRFAFPNEADAKHNFIARKRRQVKILEAKLGDAKTALSLAENNNDPTGKVGGMFGLTRVF